MARLCTKFWTVASNVRITVQWIVGVTATAVPMHCNGNSGRGGGDGEGGENKQIFWF